MYVMMAMQLQNFEASILQNRHAREYLPSNRPHHLKLTWSMAKAFCSSASSACAADCLRSYEATTACEWA